ncbi:hypothetical protein H5410_059514 [Solanum commersonii]|uniref:Uncharacterized protein n=1 Tax=Solanum commersonii TaxID=4109 RepID=A0A9J5W377_SOLCO|nr:hypothetical protein H5410_059514 [Solanum commersonii]
MFYESVLFKTIGFGVDTSALSIVITGEVNIIATILVSSSGISNALLPSKLILFISCSWNFSW